MTTYLNEPILTIYYSYDPTTGKTTATVGDKTFPSISEAHDYIEKVKHEFKEDAGVLGDSGSEGEGREG